MALVVPFPDELKLENYERRPNAALFDRLDLVVFFHPGHKGIGAVVKNFRDAIKSHDEMVVKVEAQMVEVEIKKRIYKKKNRLFRNLDSAWNLILENPVQYYEYLNLFKTLTGYCQRSLVPIPQSSSTSEGISALTPAQHTYIKQLMEDEEDPIEKVKLTGLYIKYTELEPVCSRQHLVYLSFARAREERDSSVQQLLEAEKHLQFLKESEKKLASKISDDHILADETHRPLSLVFPNVQVGYILSQINGEYVENLPCGEVISIVKRSRSPHNAVFLRYDYRFDPFNVMWRSLQELREMGVCVEDPLLQRMHFISLAAQGDTASVHQLLMAGEDPNCCDLTGSTAMVAAATNQHGDVVKRLFKAGGDVNMTDRNMMTPMLYCANRGYTDMCKLLLEMGADRLHVDRSLRGPMFYSVMSGQIETVELFFQPDHRDFAERLWGFTPLHLAANLGHLHIVNFLLEKGCSIYKTDKKNRIAELIASECGHKEVTQRLVQQRLNAPGQFIYEREEKQHLHDTNTSSPIQFWIGDSDALHVYWCADVDVTAVIYISSQLNNLPQHAAWLRKESIKQSKTGFTNANPSRGFAAKKPSGLVAFLALQVSDLPEDASNQDNWAGLEAVIPQAFEFAKELSERDGKQKLLIADETCGALAPALTAVLLLLLDQVRMPVSLRKMKAARPGADVGRDVERGLKLLQHKADAKVMKRMHKQARDSVVCSIGF